MQWIKCSDRLPTEADGDDTGLVICRFKTDDGVLMFDFNEFDGIEPDEGIEWLARACEREQQEQERSE
jgi:hypothetical protein